MIIGNSDTGANITGNDSRIVGTKFAAPITGTIETLSLYLKVTNAEKTTKGAFYSSDRTSILGSTEEITVPISYAWKTFKMLTPLKITQGTEYYIVSWSGGGAGDEWNGWTTSIGVTKTQGDHVYVTGEGNDKWPADISGDETAANENCSSYGTYIQPMTMTGNMFFPNIKYKS